MDKMLIFIVISLFIYEVICLAAIIAVNYPGLSWFVKINACQIRKVAADYSFEYLVYRINRQRLSKLRMERTSDIIKIKSFVKAHEDLGKEIAKLKELTEELLENSDLELKEEEEVPISTTWSNVPKQWESFKISRFDVHSPEKSFKQFLKTNYGIEEGDFYLPNYQPELEEDERKQRLLRGSPIERKKRLAKLLATTEKDDYENDDTVIEQRYQYYLRKLGVRPMPYNTQIINEETEEEQQEDENQQFQPEDENQEFQPEDENQQFQPEDENQQFQPEDENQQFQPEDENQQFQPEDENQQFQPEDENQQFQPEDVQELPDEEYEEQLNVEQWLKKRQKRKLKRQRRQFKERYNLNATVGLKSPCKLTESRTSVDSIPKSSGSNTQYKTSEESLPQNTSTECVSKTTVSNEYNLPEPMPYGGYHSPYMNDMHYCPIDPNRRSKHSYRKKCNKRRSRPVRNENDYYNSIEDEEPVCFSSNQDTYDNLPTQSTHEEEDTCQCKYYNANYMNATSELEIPENTHNTMPFNESNPFFQSTCCNMPNNYTDSCHKNFWQSDVGSCSMGSNSSSCTSCEQLSASAMPLRRKRISYSTRPERHNITDYIRAPEITSSGSETTRPSNSQKKICFYKILRNLRNTSSDCESTDLLERD